MSIQPRAYQSEILATTRQAMRPDPEKGRPAYKRVAIQSVQGSGKSVLAAMIAVSATSKGTRCLILSHRDKIMEQNVEKMESLGLKPATVSRTTKSIPTAALCIAMSQTVSSRISRDKKWAEWLRSFDLIVADECHRGEHDQVLDGIREGCSVVGLTGTLIRCGSSQKQLGLYYDCIVKGPSAKELIELGFLVPSRNFTFIAPKIDDVVVHGSTGDYHQKILQARFGDRQRYSGIVKEWLRLTPNTKTVVFCTGAEHAIGLTQQFVEAGISARYLLSSKFPKTDGALSAPRKKLLADFKQRKFEVLVSVGVLNTGFDDPGIETVVLDMATKSYSLYAQSVGRGSRPALGKTYFNVLDFGNNLAEHKEFESDTAPCSLWHSQSSGNGVAMTKECPYCKRLVLISARECCYCGHKWLNQREEYEIELREYIKNLDEENMSTETWIRHKVLEGWSNNRILMTICKRNAGRERKAFMDAIEILRSKEGKVISSAYWYFFKKNILFSKKNKP